jgi:hypothetical protein
VQEAEADATADEALAGAPRSIWYEDDLAQDVEVVIPDEQP